MFLRNYDNYWTILNSMQFFVKNACSSGTSTTQWGDGYFNLKAPSGSLAYSLFVGDSYYTSSFGSDYSWSFFYGPISLNTSSICLGTGSEPVTYDDYKLSGDVVSLALTQQSSSTKYIPETNKWRRSIICTCTNLTESDITVGEWGLYKWNYNNGSGSTRPSLSYSNTSSQVALMFREVLDTPITIAAGTTTTFTFSIDVPMPNHP